MLNSTSNRKPSPVPTNSTNANNGSSMFSPSADSLAIAYATAFNYSQPLFSKTEKSMSLLQLAQYNRRLQRRAMKFLYYLVEHFFRRVFEASHRRK
jgi:hypothetical protein